MLSVTPRTEDNGTHTGHVGLHVCFHVIYFSSQLPSESLRGRPEKLGQSLSVCSSIYPEQGLGWIETETKIFTCFLRNITKTLGLNSTSVVCSRSIQRICRLKSFFVDCTE